MSNDKIFFISNSINLLGPFAKEELLRMLYNGEIKKDIRIYDISENKWMRMESHPKFTKKDFEENNLVIIGLHSSNSNATGIKIKKKIRKPQKLAKKTPSPQVPQKPKSQGPSPGDTVFINTAIVDKQSLLVSEKWYLQDGNFKLGPYHYLSLIYMLREGVITFEHAILREDQSSWKTMDEIVSAREMNTLAELDCIRNHVDIPREMSLRKIERKDVDFYHYFLFNGEQYTVQAYDIAPSSIAFVSQESDFIVSQPGECAFVQRDESILVVHGKIIRRDDVKSRKIGANLFKYAFVFDQDIDLENLSFSAEADPNADI